jgi:hypothetical protein
LSFLTTGTASSNTSYQPSSLLSSYQVVIGADNGYFANTNTIQTSVSINDTKANLQTLLFNASKWYSNSAGPLVAPTFSITVAGNLIPPNINAALSAFVDSAFDVTFIDDSAWRAAITGITVNGSLLASAAYSTTSAGKITFTPSQSELLQSAGSKAIVVKASGYSDALVTQAIGAGAATQMAITTQPTAPSLNGGALATQPVVTLRDQYGNTSSSTANVTVTQGGGGSWALGGTLTVGAVNGVATFTDLTAGHSVALTGVTLSFSSGSFDPVSSNSFNIPRWPQR